MIYCVAAGFCIVAIMFYIVMKTLCHLYAKQEHLEEGVKLALETIKVMIDADAAKRNLDKCKNGK